MTLNRSRWPGLYSPDICLKPQHAEAATLQANAERATVIHPLYVRITHWINALAMLVMIGSGWQIYNASPLFRSRFRAITLGGWLAGALLWHFAAMWLLDRERPRLSDRSGLPPAVSGAGCCRSARGEVAAISRRR